MQETRRCSTERKGSEVISGQDVSAQTAQIVFHRVNRALNQDLPRSRKMFYTYVIQSNKDGKWYTGCTHDLRKRFSQHQNNQVPSTKGRGPFELIYYEACLNEQDAFAREKYLKSGRGKHYLKKRLKRFLS